MPEQLDLDPALVAGVRADVAAEDLGEFFGRAMQVVATSIPPDLIVGPVVAVYHRDDGDRFDVTIGVPVSAAPEGDAGDSEGGSDSEAGPDSGEGDSDLTVTIAELPGGPALRETHHGDYPSLRDAYAALDAALAERGAARTIAWEAYLVGPADDADSAAWVTTVTVPLPSA